ncbi:MAG: antibiotic biosynthesis monooxygenase [Gammaproteobacteria bacterium]|nr:antibiotic biosynthesis monooxygenase [Gammaproteobacteria bacterium]
MTIDSHHVEEFIKTFESKQKDIAKFAGCQKVELLYDVACPNILYTISHWDTEDHLQDYRDSGFFEDTWTTVKKLFAGKPEAWSLKQVEA